MTVIHELKQRKFLAGSRKFSIDKNGDILVEYKSLLGTKEYKVSLADLSPNFERIKRNEIKWLITAGCFLAVVIFICYEAIVHDPLLFIYGILFLIPAYLCVYKFQNNSFDIVAIFFAQTGRNAFNIWYNNPDEKTFISFTSTLKKHIDKVHVNQNISEDDKLQIYSRYIQFFCDEGILSNEEGDKLLQRTMKRIEARKKKRANVVSLVK